MTPRKRRQSDYLCVLLMLTTLTSVPSRARLKHPGLLPLHRPEERDLRLHLDLEWESKFAVGGQMKCYRSSENVVFWTSAEGERRAGERARHGRLPENYSKISGRVAYLKQHNPHEAEQLRELLAAARPMKTQGETHNSMP